MSNYTPAQWLNAGHFFPYRKHQIFYRQHRSKKDCVLLLHGFPTSSWDWNKVWDDLSGQYRLLAPDFLGFGFSDKPIEYRYSIFDQADLLEYLISEVGSVQFHILAHDYGVTVAQELVARFNEKKKEGTPYFKIKSVCFLNGGLFPGAYQPMLIQKILCSSAGPVVAKMMNRFFFGRSLNKTFGKNTKATDEELSMFWEIINHHQGKQVIPATIQYMRERVKHGQRWTEALQQTGIPLRLINGPEDPISGIKMAHKYKALIRDADIVLLDGIGHYPQTEAPEKVVERYIQFIEKISGHTF